MGGGAVGGEGGKRKVGGERRREGEGKSEGWEERRE